MQFTQALTAPLLSPLTEAITAVYGGVFNPTTLFSDGSNGVLYDNNDLTSFYLDSAMTTPATVNGLVGLQLDKSKAVPVARRNLLTWTEQFSNAVWGKANASITANTIAAPDGTMTADTLTATSATGNISQIVATAGTFTLSVWIKRKTGTGNVSLVIRPGFQESVVAVTNEWVRYTYTAATTYSNVGVRLATSGDEVYIWGAQVETGSTATEYQRVVTGNGDWMPGNHRYQTTTGSKPILRGTPTGLNLFASYGTPGTGWANSGSGVATATATTGSIPTNVVPANTRVYRVRYTATVTSGAVRLTMGGVNGATRSASGTYEEYIAATSTAALSFQGVTSFTGTVSALDVRDVSADAVTAPYGLHFDGFDDFLQTAPVDFSATDKMTVCMGVRMFNSAVTGVIAELSATIASNIGAFTVLHQGAATQHYVSGSTGIAGRQLTTAAFPVTIVSSSAYDIAGATASDEVVPRINGSLGSPTIASAGPAGTGNFGNYALYFGRRGGTSLPFNGLDYGGCIKGGGFSAAQLASVERWTAQRTGVTI